MVINTKESTKNVGRIVPPTRKTAIVEIRAGVEGFSERKESFPTLNMLIPIISFTCIFHLNA